MFRLLIAEDDDLIRRSICRDFPWETWGYQLLGDAPDGKSCLELSHKLCPDVVLTDIRMPFLDGLNLLQELRKERYCPEVVLLSGYDEFRYAQKGMNLGAFTYILKTEVFDELEGVMARLLLHLRNTRSNRILHQEVVQRQNSTEAVQYAIEYTAHHLNEGVTVAEIAHKFELSANYLSQRFRQETGMTYGNYVKKLRLQHAKDMLSNTHVSLDIIAQEIGFQSVQYFCRFFRDETGETPGGYRRKIRS